MDWTLAIDRQREALLRMLAALFVMTGGGEAERLPRHVCLAVLRVLRPAESALRRLLVVVLASLALRRRIFVERLASRGSAIVPCGSRDGVPSFALFDPRQRVGFERPRHPAGLGPRIWEPGMDYPVFETKTVPTPDDMLNAKRLCRRLLALQAALGDLPKQARRLARWEAKREAARAKSGRYIRAMRHGRPPGYRARPRHPVDFVLGDCHALALYALHDPPDTS